MKNTSLENYYQFGMVRYPVEEMSDGYKMSYRKNKYRTVEFSLIASVAILVFFF